MKLTVSQFSPGVVFLKGNPSSVRLRRRIAAKTRVESVRIRLQGCCSRRGRAGSTHSGMQVRGCSGRTRIPEPEIDDEPEDQDLAP